jgi:hypothetical protein
MQIDPLARRLRTASRTPTKQNKQLDQIQAAQKTKLCCQQANKTY